MTGNKISTWLAKFLSLAAQFFCQLYLTIYCKNQRSDLIENARLGFASLQLQALQL